jgi:predicted metal-dependent peptidase
MTGPDHSERATRALRKLGEADPAFAALALWCAHRDADAAAAEAWARTEGGAAEPPLAWTDGATIRYGPGFAELPLHEQVGLAAHQILHVAFRHAPRAAGMWRRFGAGFDPALFNLATDALVNETLQLAGYALPRPSVSLVELLAEALGEATTPGAAVGRWDAEALYLRLAAQRAGATGRRAGEADGPEGGGGPADRARAYALRRRFAPDVDAGRADPEAARREAAEEADWRQRVARAFEAGRRAGAGIGALGWRLADLPQPRTPWETALRGLVARAVIEHPRRSFARPTRRGIALDDAARRGGEAEPAFEPAALPRRAAPRVAVGVDASASVDETLLALFAAQLAGIGRRAGAEVHVLVFDEAVRSRARMRGADWEREIAGVAFARGGGTSFVEVLAEAARLDPAAIVILTDLDGPFGPPPRVPVIWAVPDADRAPPPPFGRVLSLAR